MRIEQKGIAIFITSLLFMMLACAVPGFSGSGATATPAVDNGFLTFSVPAPGYAVTLNPGDRVPGSRLQYLGQEGDAYRVRVNGQESLKRIGDSFAWAGIVGSGVYGEYNLRLTSTLLGPLPAAGGVKLTILDWSPTEVSVLPDLSNALHFGNIIVDYTVPQGEAVPATNMIYTGPITQGSTQYAQFSRSSGLSSFAVGDSVVWEGALRENTFLRYNLRVISFDENNVHLGGTAEIWLTEPTYP